jgi:hypothetical protein
MKLAPGILIVGSAFGIHALELKPVVEIEEDVYTYTSANNGAGPEWCAGSTCLVRSGTELYASGLETVPDAKPLNNCRWLLFHRGSNNWERVWVDEGRTREPSPMVAFQDGRVFVSANPTLGSGAQPNGGPARPEIFQFTTGAGTPKPMSLLPTWQGTPAFREHSYRSFAADGKASELILFQNIDYTHAEWTFRDQTGKWSARGQLKWPWGAEYDQPEPIRICYPNVVIQDRTVHFFGVSDVHEPYKAWRDYKRELTGKQWDYDFRRLFYTWTRDITQAPFADWVEIASRDRTCGRLWPCDLWVAPNGDVHLLWTEHALDERLRAKFFPDAKQSDALNHAILRDGKIVQRQALVESSEGAPGLIASAARFHVTPDQRLFVVFRVGGTAATGANVSENRLVELLPDGAMSAMVRIAFQKTFTSYFTATVRAGSMPSYAIELLGQREGSPNTISYAKVTLHPHRP